jgi:hypothetical protein
VSLNNRIAIRDNYEARGLVVDLQAMTAFKNSARTGSTTDTIILEPEKPQEGQMNQPVAEAEVEDGVKSESSDRTVILSLSYDRAVAVTIDVV